jgi:hypothetical protein
MCKSGGRESSLFHSGGLREDHRTANPARRTSVSEQPARYKLITGGNHEYPIEAQPDKWRRRLSNAMLLVNESITIEGIKLWGVQSPHCMVALSA